MADRAMIAAAKVLVPQQPAPDMHPVLGLIGTLWTNFASGKTAMQKRQIVAAWESALADIPVGLQLEAVRRKARSGHVWPPTSPAEIRKWCDEVQKPISRADVLWFRQCIGTGVLDDDFCKRQIEKYKAAKAAGVSAYAGWEAEK